MDEMNILPPHIEKMLLDKSKPIDEALALADLIRHHNKMKSRSIVAPSVCLKKPAQKVMPSQLETSTNPLKKATQVFLFLLLIVLPYAFWYLIFSGIMWDFNPGNWSRDYRISAMLCAIVTMVFLVICAKAQD